MATDMLSSLLELDAIPSVVPEPEDGWYTAEQIREKLGWGKNKTRRIIKRGLDMGIYEMRKFPIHNAAEQTYYQPRYRLVEREESGEGG